MNRLTPRAWEDRHGVLHCAVTQELPGDEAEARAVAKILLGAGEVLARVQFVDSQKLDGAITYHFKEV